MKIKMRLILALTSEKSGETEVKVSEFFFQFIAYILVENKDNIYMK